MKTYVVYFPATDGITTILARMFFDDFEDAENFRIWVGGETWNYKTNTKLSN